MVIREREIGGQEKSYSFKGLRLAPPEIVQNLGIPAEGPVFVSRNIDTQEECNECGIFYRPLIYQVGMTVESHHFHPTKGGIYFYRARESFLRPGLSSKLRPEVHSQEEDRELLVVTSYFHLEGWVAILEPSGLEEFSSVDCSRRSERVRVIQVIAHCQGCLDGESLSEGFLLPWGPWGGNLVPTCRIPRIPDPDIRFKFKNTPDGHVVFGSISLLTK